MYREWPVLFWLGLATGMVAVQESNRRRRRQQQVALSQSGSDDQAASYARYSSEMQREESITDQQRKCREAAAANGHVIPPECLFADDAVSGTKRQRAGLNAMLAAAKSRQFSTLYVHSLSRLARESVITMPILKNLVYTCGIRFVSISEGVDSSCDGWELLASIYAVMHERYVKELGENVFRGQEGTVLAGYSVGDWCLGYTSVCVAEGTDVGRERNPKPRMQYAVNPSTCVWVIRIFHWFVHESRSISGIVRELNQRKAPKDHRSSTPYWTHGLVREVLSREKYVGIWPWGETKRVREPESGRIRQVPRPDEECQQYTRNFPELRLIDDDTFHKAQDLLRRNAEIWAPQRQQNGQLTGRPAGVPRQEGSRLLSGLVKCAACQSPFVYTGNRLVCSQHRQGRCDLKTSLPADLAERLLLQELGCRIVDSGPWFEMVYTELLARFREHQRQEPAVFDQKRQELQQLDQQVRRLLNLVEAGTSLPDLDERLRTRQSERTRLQRELRQLETADARPAAEPARDWLRERLQQMGTVLHDATPAANKTLHQLLGGSILVEPAMHPLSRKHYLRGRFSLRTAAVCAAVDGRPDAVVDEAETEELSLDFLDPEERRQVEDKAEAALQYYDEGLPMFEIAERLDISRSRCTLYLNRCAEWAGRDLIDGRSRRSKLDRKHKETPVYRLIADEVMEHYQNNRLLADIADILKIDRNTVTKAIRFWHTSRNLPVPDGRGRRKELDIKSRQPADQSPRHSPPPGPESGTDLRQVS